MAGDDVEEFGDVEEFVYESDHNRVTHLRLPQKGEVQVDYLKLSHNSTRFN